MPAAWPEPLGARGVAVAAAWPGRSRTAPEPLGGRGVAREAAGEAAAMVGEKAWMR